jgi:hypothetical protein
MIIRRRRLLVLLLIGFVGSWLLVLGSLLWYANLFEADNYTSVEDGLYMGGYVKKPPRGTAAVLNLCEQEDPYRAAVHVWEPIKDAAPAPDVDWLRRMVVFIETNRNDGRTTFVHCRNGVSRSGLVVVAYEMQKNHWTRERALAFVRERRAEVRPNTAFMELPDQWQRELQIASDDTPAKP